MGDQQHQVDWDGTRVLDWAARPVQLKVKEILHIKRTPAKNRLRVTGLLDRNYEETRGRGQLR